MITRVAITTLMLAVTLGYAETISPKSVSIAVSQNKTNLHSKKTLSLQQEKDAFATTLSNLRKIKRKLKTKSGNRVNLDSSKIDSYIKSLQDFNKDRNNMPNYLRREVMDESQDIVNKLQHYIDSGPTRRRTRGPSEYFSQDSKKMSKCLDFSTGKINEAVSKQNEETTIKILNEFKNDITVSYIASGEVKNNCPVLYKDGRRNFTGETKEKLHYEKIKSLFNWAIWARRGNTRISEYFFLDHDQLKANKIREIRLRLLEKIDHDK
jgi:hypothetical protein